MALKLALSRSRPSVPYQADLSSLLICFLARLLPDYLSPFRICPFHFQAVRHCPKDFVVNIWRKETSSVIGQCGSRDVFCCTVCCCQWHALDRSEQAKYYEMARKEKELHMQMYPGWSARDNYATHTKKKKLKPHESAALNDHHPQPRTPFSSQHRLHPPLSCDVADVAANGDCGTSLRCREPRVRPGYPLSAFAPPLSIHFLIFNRQHCAQRKVPVI